MSMIDYRYYQSIICLDTFKNLAFIATIIVLKDINAAPIAGLKIIPNGKSTPAANGIATILYPVAHPRF